jgi:NDP-sugar pyrophosphorylase family protein
MNSRLIDQIPIIDTDGHAVGIHLIHEILGRVERPNWAIIMAGGRGTRLHPITHHIPKPMIKVAGRPILERLVLHLVGHGIQRIFISVHYLPHLIEEHFGDGREFGCQIEYLREEEPLGTGGALSLLPEKPSHPCLVMNGDLITQFDIGALLRHHEAMGQAATVAAAHYLHQVPFGCLEVTGDHLIGIEEKPTLLRLVNAGIYVLSPSVFDRLPHPPFTLPECIEALLQQRAGIGYFLLGDDWLDVGQPEQLRQARGGEK